VKITASLAPDLEFRTMMPAAFVNSSASKVAENDGLTTAEVAGCDL
jgi:hypothetical protein